jgi:secondary thiamine-phosphate synthase enzyme
MKVAFKEIEVSTRSRTELVDVTGSVEEAVNRSEIADGLCIVHTVHSTAAIIVNEHEAGLVEDIVKKVQQTFPRRAGWLHDRVDDNADAHLASSFIGPAKVFPLREGRLVRGTWQNIFLLELDGPRVRNVVVEVMGE